MKSIGIAVIAAALGLGGVSRAYAEGAGTSGGNILSIPVGARAIAMGESYTALADDASSLYWNPAGLALLNQSQATFTHNRNIQDTTYNHLSVATPLESGGLGASLTHLSFGTIPGYDNSGNATGNVSAHSAVATVGGALLGDNWSAGAVVKGVQATLADEKATGFASDLGMNAIYPREIFGGATLRAAATIRNLGTGLKFINQRDPFPTEYRGGIALLQLADRHLNVSLDAAKARDNKVAFYSGAEYTMARYLTLRAGYAGNHTESNGLRMGIGLNVMNFSFDYAFSQYGDLGMAHRYEVTYRFGAMRPMLSPEERRILRRGKQAMREGNYGEAVMLFNSLIELEPRYKPVRPLLRTAMRSYQKQEDLANKPNDFQWPAQASSHRDINPGEAGELEQLLNMGNETMARGNVPAGGKGVPAQ